MDDFEKKINEEVVDENASAEVKEKKSFKTKICNVFEKIGAFFVKIGKTVWRWMKRAFCGASKELAEDGKKKDKKAEKKDERQNKNLEVEKIVSPTKQIVRNFFRKPLAVVSLVIVACMFLFVIIGPIISPIDLSYKENMHENIAPGFKFMSVPKNLKNNVRSISSYSFFSVGTDNDNNLYVWGSTKMPTAASKSDMSVLPSDLKGKKVAFAAAGYDHAIAITTEGKVVGWGEYDCGQYGDKGSLANSASAVYKMPSAIMNGTINAEDVAQLVCGYQVSAIVMKSGKVYAWGNYAGAKNLRALNSLNNVREIQFTNSAAVALLKDGTLWFGKASDSFDTVETTDADGKEIIISLADYIGTRKVTDIATTNTALAMVFDDGNYFVAGTFTPSKNKFVKQPKLSSDEKIVDIAGGSKHFTMLTDKGKIYSFGQNYLNQCKVAKGNYSASDKLFVGSFQNYVTSASGKLKTKWGCRGYLFGTDEFGRSIFSRIMHGGKMTMTIGAVAVIISTIIAIIIGCLSGYFGGWVDMILMRITEIFSAIPFLPFALILSAVLAGSNVTENTRIFMIMVILGLLSWTGLARMIRGQVLAEREKEFVTAAKAMGVKEGKIAFKHILPNVISIILVSVTLDFAGCMLTESSLSYLGFGVKLPRPTWGNMLDGCNNELVIGTLWWRWLFPALFLLITTIAINIIGDALRDVMDPKAQER